MQTFPLFTQNVKTNKQKTKTFNNKNLNKSETKLTAGVLKQDPNAQNVFFFKRKKRRTCFVLLLKSGYV